MATWTYSQVRRYSATHICQCCVASKQHSARQLSRRAHRSPSSRKRRLLRLASRMFPSSLNAKKSMSTRPDPYLTAREISSCTPRCNNLSSKWAPRPVLCRRHDSKIGSRLPILTPRRSRKRISKKRARTRQQTKRMTQTRRRKKGKEVEVSLASVTIR